MTVFRGQAELLRRFREGDRDALETVYRAYVDRVAGVLRFGFRVPSTGAVVAGLAGNAHDLADLVQDVFVKAFAPAARQSFDGARDYGPFLFAIARNAAVDWARRGRREIPMEWSELDRAAELTAPPDDVPWASEAIMAAVRRYLQGIDQELRSVHEVRYLEGLSQREAASRLGIGRQRLRTLEARLRDGLRRELAAARLEP